MDEKQPERGSSDLSQNSHLRTTRDCTLLNDRLYPVGWTNE